MIKYAKVIDNDLGLCEVGLGTNSEFYKSIGMTELDVEISEKDNQWYLSEKCPHYTPEEKEAIERARLDSLTLTPSDVERALLKAKGMDFDDLKAFLKEEGFTDLQIKAIGVELRANNFYRGATMGEAPQQIRIVDTIGALLGYTPEDMDYLFENKELPEKEVEPETDTDTESETDTEPETDTETEE
jgi:hypothetical protein